MKIRILSSAAAILAAASFVPAAAAQQAGFAAATPPGTGSSVGSFATQPSSIRVLQTSPIAPMPNPIAPMMTSPIQPFVQTIPPQPFIRYGTVPTVVVPGPSVNTRPVYVVPRGRHGRGSDVNVVVPGGTVFAPGATIVVQAPERDRGRDFDRDRRDARPTAIPDTSPASSFNYVPPVEVEPQILVTSPRPVRVLQRPPLGISRADVLLKLGEPWGTLSAGNRENLYFDGMIVVLDGGRVVQVR